MKSWTPLHAHAHPLDPPAQHLAAQMAGKIVAMRLLEVDDFMPYLIAAALEAGYPGDVTGLRCRLSSSMRDAAWAWEMIRDRAAWAIRQTVRPMLEAWRQPPDIRHAAFRTNAAWDDPLCNYEVIDILREEAARFMRTKGRRRHA